MTEITQRTLYTKDGSVTGNAFLIRQVSQAEVNDFAPCVADYLTQSKQKLYWLETDFGNKFRLSTNEINEQYTFGPEQDYDHWRAARQNLIDDMKD